MKTMPIEELLNINLDPNANKPLYIQLYEIIVQQIVSKQISSTARLPASRKLASQLNISRNTVQKAYEQLIAEGYLKSIKGSGVYVNAEIPDEYCQPPKKHKKISPIATQVSFSTHTGDFTPGIPDLKAFPNILWSRSCQKVLRLQYNSLLFSERSCGNEQLKKTLVDYLAYARNVHCSTEQIIITSGAQEAINIAMRVLLNSKAMLAIENPGYRGAYHAVESCQANLCLIPVLEDGIDLNYLKKQRKKPTLIYITPSHQYPLGSTLPISKRLALIEYAQKTNSYIIEDDYDSEFHYKTKPLPALQGLDTHERVIYLGTFSKVLFPAIRLGFLIIPKKLISKFKIMKRYGFGQTPLFNQAALNTFILAGHFSRHVKRMRLHYAEKYQVIKTACEQHLPSNIKVYANDIGLHITLRFPNHIKDSKIIKKLNQENLFPARLSQYCYGKEKQQGLVIGFSNTDFNQLEKGIIKIAKGLKSSL